MSGEEDDSQSNLPVGDHVCCVGGREEILRTLFLSFSHFCDPPTAQRCHANVNKQTQEKAFFSSIPLIHRAKLHANDANETLAVCDCYLATFVIRC